MPKLFKWLETEAERTIPAIIYFAITFTLVHLSQVLSRPPGDTPYTGYLGALIGALIAGKIIIIAESLPFINAFSRKPLVYNIFWKFSIYGFFALLVQIVDFLTKSTIRLGDFNLALHHTWHAFLSPLCWSIQIWVLMLFFIFVVFSDLERVIGRHKMLRILFG
jgi:hypothetical protein